MAVQVIDYGPTLNRWPGALPLSAVRYRVAHTSEGLSSLGWLMNQDANVSYTFYVPRVGPKAYRIVPKGDAAWHAGITCDVTTPLWGGGNPNRESEGIGFEGFAREPLTPFQLAAWAVIMADDKPWCGHFELSGCRRTDPGAGNMALLVAALAEEDDDVGLLPDERQWLWEAKEVGHEAKNGIIALRRDLAAVLNIPAAMTAPRRAALERDAKGTWDGDGLEPMAPERTSTKKKRRR